MPFFDQYIWVDTAYDILLPERNQCWRRPADRAMDVLNRFDPFLLGDPLALKCLIEIFDDIPFSDAGQTEKMLVSVGRALKPMLMIPSSLKDLTSDEVISVMDQLRRDVSLRDIRKPILIARIPRP